MDIIDPILGIAEKLYSLCNEVTANKKRCARLAERVSSLTQLVKAIKERGLGSQPELVQRGLREFKLTLESAQDVVEKYSSSNCLKRIIQASDLGEEFSWLNERLNDAAQLLSLSLQVEQRDKMEGVFQEARRREQDQEDRRCDCEELQKSLQSYTEKNLETKQSVDNVHKDVKDIKNMLHLLNKPSISQLDIKEIRPEELTYDLPIEPIMKSGQFELFKGEYNKFNVAIKRYTYSVNVSPSQVRSIFNKEVDTMKRFESPHILRMFGICVQEEDGSNPTYLIVTEFCEKGSLRQVLDSSSKLSWDRKTRMCLDAAQGLYRLHQSEEKFKVHGCITSSRFLVDAGYRIKLAGFELAKTEISLKKCKDKKSSSVTYVSPQQLESLNHPYDKACEIYSFGIVLWEIATRQVPFKDCSSHCDIYKKVCEEKMMEPLPNDCPSQLRSIINACRSYEPFQRPSAGVLVDRLHILAQQCEED